MPMVRATNAGIAVRAFAATPDPARVRPHRGIGPNGKCGLARSQTRRRNRPTAVW
jgi:hypothetical protein